MSKFFHYHLNGTCFVIIKNDYWTSNNIWIGYLALHNKKFNLLKLSFRENHRERFKRLT